MTTILVAGIVNLETTVRVERFPVAYEPVRYAFGGIASRFSGVGLNVALALRSLGDDVRLLSLVGRDPAGDQARAALVEAGLAADWLLPTLDESVQSAILYDGDGRRAIFADFKDIQEHRYPLDVAEAAMDGCDVAVLCNVNFARPLLALAGGRGLPIASDIHAIADLDDPYNRDWMAAADILFMSHERLPMAPEAWAAALLDRYPAPRLVGIGLGAEGALLAERGGVVTRAPAVAPRPVVSTVGAGDALFAAFLHRTLRGDPPADALRRAVHFAGHKIGARGGSEGFLTGDALAGVERGA